MVFIHLKNLIMRSYTILVAIFFSFLSGQILAQTQTVEDDFEGNGTITTWFGDDCLINTSQPNPYPDAFNNSATVMAYEDVGGPYANVRFDIDSNFDLSTDYVFSLKIYFKFGVWIN